MNQRKTVNDFIKKYSLKDISLNSITEAVTSQGYTIIEFNNIFNEEAVSNLIEALDLDDYIASSKGFTYVSSNYRLVFVHEDLNDEEKLIVLAHEEGHIINNHFSHAPIIGVDVAEEYEANEFAQELLKKQKRLKTLSKIRNKKFLIIIITLIITLLFATSLSGVLAISNHNEHQVQANQYYVTDSGEKYHKRDCIIIKNRKNVRKLTEEEYQSGEYEPCDVCLPDE